jgi:hypothetical protein
MRHGLGWWKGGAKMAGSGPGGRESGMARQGRVGARMAVPRGQGRPLAGTRGRTRLGFSDVVVDAQERRERHELPVDLLADPLALPAAVVVHAALVDVAVGIHQHAVAARRPPRRVRRPAPGGGSQLAARSLPALDLCGRREATGRGRKKKERVIQSGGADLDFLTQCLMVF